MKKDIQFWQNHIEAQSKSGLSKKEYCVNENLIYTTFIGWGRRLSVKQEHPNFVEIKPINKEQYHSLPDDSGRILIRYDKQNGFQIELNFPLNLIERLFSR